MNIFDRIKRMERRKLIIWTALGSTSLIILIVIIVVASSGGTDGITKGSQVLESIPIIDGHNDLPNNLREILKNQIKDFKFDTNLVNDSIWGANKCKYCYTDLPRMREGKVGAQFWVAYVYCTTQYKDAVAQTLEQIDVIRRLIRKYPNDLQLVTTADGIMDAYSQNKIGSLIGVEGGHSIDSRLGVLRTFYDLGVRYMTLTHTCNTPWADASPFTEKPVHDLTDFGKNLVQEMNKIGMMIDLAHVSANVMREAIKVSKAPVMFSHSNAFTVYNHHRNVPDDVLDSLKKNDGIIMINFYPGFLKNTTRDGDATIETVMEHINYVAKRIGVDYIGIGADFDGVESSAKGLEDVSKYPALFDALFKNNSVLWTQENLQKLASQNLIRVFRKVEEVRDNLDKEHHFEDWIPKEAIEGTIPKDLQICRTERDVAGIDYPKTTESSLPSQSTSASVPNNR